MAGSSPGASETISSSGSRFWTCRCQIRRPTGPSGSTRTGVGRSDGQVSEYHRSAVVTPSGSRQLARTARAVHPRWDYVDVVREQLRVGIFRGDPRIMMEKYSTGSTETRRGSVTPVAVDR